MKNIAKDEVSHALSSVYLKSYSIEYILKIHKRCFKTLNTALCYPDLIYLTSLAVVRLNVFGSSLISAAWYFVVSVG